MMHGDRFFTYGGYMGHGVLGGWSWLIVLGVVLIISAVVFFIVKGSKTKNTGGDALGILDRKFAEGELTEEEYLKRKEVLQRK